MNVSAARAAILSVPVPVQAVEIINVMSLSPVPADHRFLETALCEAGSPTRRWIVKKQLDFSWAFSDLRREQFSLVLCDDTLPWRDLLHGQIQELPVPPLLVVSSRLADDRLWAEALNLGAYDVLAKPFHKTEVIRVIESAWLRWHHQVQMSGTSMSGMTAAS
jgi:DNA-binding response OmpR family regulator